MTTTPRLPSPSCAPLTPTLPCCSFCHHWMGQFTSNNTWEYLLLVLCFRNLPKCSSSLSKLASSVLADILLSQSSGIRGTIGTYRLIPVQRTLLYPTPMYCIMLQACSAYHNRVPLLHQCQLYCHPSY